MNQNLLRAEGLFVFAASATLYFMNGYGWLAFVLLLFALDLSMIGYASGNRIGAYIYNVAHTYTVPLLLLLLALIFPTAWLTLIGLIWTAHIGLDRMMGYGLKYVSGFKDTHMQRL